MKTRMSASRENSIASFELDKAKTAIEQFIYSCSHSLRAPLKSISGLVYLLKNRAEIPSADPDEYLTSIEMTITKMESLLNDLAQFLTNSRREIVADCVHVDTLVNDVLSDFESQIVVANIKVKTTLEQNVKFYTDESRFRVVLSHILTNAINYQEASGSNKRIGIKITVSQNECRISVRDNGIGIKDEILPRVCELFYRGSTLSTGAGIGLYVVNEIVEEIGGQFFIRSVHERGTQVVVTFPNLTA